MAYIFDLDQTIVDSSIAENYRQKREWQTVYSLIPQFKLYEGISDVFEILHEKKEKICIVTASPEKYCKTVLRQFGLRVDNTVCYHDTKLHKPHPEPILRAVELLGDSPQNTVSIGDADKDVTAARNAGVISCLALWGGQEGNPNVVADADYVFASVADLKEFITRGGKHGLS